MVYYPQANGFSSPLGYDFTPKLFLKREVRRESGCLAWGIVVSVLALNIFSYLIYMAAAYFGFRINGSVWQVCACLSYILSVFLPFFVIFCVRKKQQCANELIPFEKVSFWTGIGFVLPGVAACLLANIPTQLVVSFLEEIGLDASLPEEVLPTTAVGIGLSVLELAVIPPLVEEFAFRGIILSRLRKFGDGFAVISTAILFALYHGNIEQLIFTFLAGLYLGFVMIKTNNLMIPMVIHGLNNGISLLFMLLTQIKGVETANMIYGFFMITVLGIGFISFILLRFTKKELFYLGRKNGIPFGLKMGAFVSNSGVIVLFLYFCFTSLQIIASNLM